MRKAELKKKIGASIRAARLAKRMTLEELASQLELTSAAAFSKYEIGENEIPSTKLVKISKILGFPIQAFIDGISLEAITATKSKENNAQAVA